ncbi:MAG: ribokinase [Sterolibacterium sp.]|jgi:ribokinase
MILVAGSANLDFVVRAPHIPVPGETVLGSDFKTFPGGKGANQAIACARAGGAETEMVLALGEDAFAAPIEASLRSAGVRLHTLRVSDHPTGTAFICVSDAAENAITVAPGANGCLRQEHLPSLKRVSHLLLQLEIPLATVAAYARRARQEGVKVVLNAAPAQPLAAELLSLVDVLVVNEGELSSLAGSPADIAQGLARIAVPCVVVTLGEQGSVARCGGELFTQPGFAVEAIDTTAAGDTFCGVLVAALSGNLGMPEALRSASAAGALACTRLGAQQSIPALADVQAMLHATPAADDDRHASLRRYCGIADGATKLS